MRIGAIKAGCAVSVAPRVGHPGQPTPQVHPRPLVWTGAAGDGWVARPSCGRTPWAFPFR